MLFLYFSSGHGTPEKAMSTGPSSTLSAYVEKWKNECLDAFVVGGCRRGVDGD